MRPKTNSLTIWKADINTGIYQANGVSRAQMHNDNYPQRVR
ncbi:hypothetical protein GCM10025767_35830 [Thalassotalea piscium]|uniref:Uncharacterized protein n=1 Tax=Thalassotalea piscium TaxID=1230533 RepID=A0A7X0TV90_9GAMM|nr:hypothetical protein [Thalassotalea piscium]